MGSRGRVDQLDSEIVDAMGELMTVMISRGEQIAKRFGIPSFCMKALHVLNPSMAMRDIGKYMHCDPSFVTSIADLLEKRGLARREPSSADRRVKNLVLTDEGMSLREKVEHEVMATMPWKGVLDADERTCLLALIRKMASAAERSVAAAGRDVTAVSASVPTIPPSTGGAPAGEVSQALTSAQPV